MEIHTLTHIFNIYFWHAPFSVQLSPYKWIIFYQKIFKGKVFIHDTVTFFLCFTAFLLIYQQQAYDWKPEQNYNTNHHHPRHLLSEFCYASTFTSVSASGAMPWPCEVFQLNKKKKKISKWKVSEEVGGEWGHAGSVSECITMDALVNESVLLTH